MPTFSANGVNIYYEETGRGFPLVWCHEFAGNYDSWDPQVKFFSRRYRNITYAARGYPPSDVPGGDEDYSQDQAVEDLYLLLRHLDIGQAYVGGLSMGGTTALNFGIAHPEMAKGLIVAAAGSGSADAEEFRRSGRELIERLRSQGMEAVAQDYANGPTRLQFREKDPKGWAQFYEGLKAHSAEGSALTYQGVQLRRPTIFALEDRLRSMNVPTLVMVGDEDEPCVDPGVFMKRTLPNCGLVFFPKSGHTINLEEPDLFNRFVTDFLTDVEAGRFT